MVAFQYFSLDFLLNSGYNSYCLIGETITKPEYENENINAGEPKCWSKKRN